MNPAIIAAVNNHYPVYSPTTTATIQNTINNKLAIVFLINSILAILPLYGINNIDAYRNNRKKNSKALHRRVVFVVVSLCCSFMEV